MQDFEEITQYLMNTKKPIKMHFTPPYVVEYTKKWVVEIKKKNDPAQSAMAEDMLTMIVLAAGVMAPVQPKTQEQDGK